MNIAVVSLISLVGVVVISCLNQRLNPGLLALLAASAIGFFLADMPLNTITDLFPSNLFVLLVSTSLVFGTAYHNGTLDKLTQRALFLIKGQRKLLPVLIFVLAFVFSALGPGNIVATAILAPTAMLLARKHNVSALLVAIMLCTGANAGAFSPFAPTGIITVGLLGKMSVSPDVIWIVFGASTVLQSISALMAYGIYLIRCYRREHQPAAHHQEAFKIEIDPLQKEQKLTICLIGLLLVGVLIFKLPLILLAMAIALTMFVLNLAEEEKILKTVPWSTILMVSGIAVLIGLMEKTGGLELATGYLASSASANSVNGLLAFLSGLISAYSSSSGVVLPAFLPLLPGLAEKMMIAGIVPMVIAVAVGSHMVDVSPLSTLGALCLAAVEDKSVRNRMFKLLMVWGVSMSVVGGLLAFIFLDVLPILG